MTERPVVFSASSVNSYLSCHLQWWFTYVLGEEGAQSEPQRVGIQVHDYAERRLRTFGRDIAIGDTSNRPEVVSLLRVVDNDIIPTYRNPILIEAEFQLEINDIPFSGILDAIDEQNVPWGYALILRDLKTTGSRPSRGKYRFAMTGYKMGAEDLLGRQIDAAMLDYVVRTKKPYYWPESLEPITDDDVNTFVATLETVANGVAREEYEPTGLGTWACKTCGYKAVCGPYQRLEAMG